MTDKDKKTFTSSFDRLPNKEAEKHFASKTLLTSAEFAEFKAYQHALAFTVAGLADKDMLTEIHKAVKGAIDNGTSFNDFKKSLKPFLVTKGWLAPELTGDDKADKTILKEYERVLNRRLKTIYHTNKATAYSAGRWERIQKTKDFLPFLQYLPSASVNKRDGHKAYYGIVRPVDDPIWQSIYPPNGFGCKCWVKQLTRTKAQKILDEQAKDGIVYNIEMEEVKHPLTGEMMTVPKGVHFSFNHNHDRLSALLKLAEDKHGAEFAEKLGEQALAILLEQKVKNLHQQMSQIEPSITKQITTIADQVGARLAGLDYRLKTIQSLQRKVELWVSRGAVLDKVLADVNDVIRYTFILHFDDFFEQYNKILALLTKQGYELVVVRNTWADGKPYKGINITFKKDDILFEMQYHTQQSFELKNGELHRLYEIARDKNTTPKQRKDLNAQMIALSTTIENPDNVEKIK